MYQTYRGRERDRGTVHRPPSFTCMSICACVVCEQRSECMHLHVSEKQTENEREEQRSECMCLCV